MHRFCLLGFITLFSILDSTAQDFGDDDIIIIPTQTSTSLNTQEIPSEDDPIKKKITLPITDDGIDLNEDVPGCMDDYYRCSLKVMLVLKVPLDVLGVTTTIGSGLLNFACIFITQTETLLGNTTQVDSPFSFLQDTKEKLYGVAGVLNIISGVVQTTRAFFQKTIDRQTAALKKIIEEHKRLERERMLTILSNVTANDLSKKKAAFVTMNKQIKLPVVDGVDLNEDVDGLTDDICRCNLKTFIITQPFLNVAALTATASSGVLNLILYFSGLSSTTPPYNMSDVNGTLPLFPVENSGSSLNNVAGIMNTVSGALQIFRGYWQKAITEESQILRQIILNAQKQKTT